MRLLVAIPVRPGTSRTLRDRCSALYGRMALANPSLDIDVVMDESPGPIPNASNLTDRSKNNAAVRQSLIDANLSRNDDYVMWVDADVVDYPADLPTRLLSVGPGITAPYVLHHHHNRFYDVAGFVQDGRHASHGFPYFQKPGRPVTDLESVGTIYICPAEIYRRGGRHEHTDGYTEHMSLCRSARRMGYRVCADSRIIAQHAYLPDWGESEH